MKFILLNKSYLNLNKKYIFIFGKISLIKILKMFFLKFKFNLFLNFLLDNYNFILYFLYSF